MPSAEPSGWLARLALRASRDGERTLVHAEHRGPLRVLKALYPEAPEVCHHVVVHPPAGIVGGDRLELDVEVQPGAHLLLTTPGATRFYRSDGLRAVQALAARVAPGARLEWLPLETLVYSGAIAANLQCFELAPGAQMLGWDLLSLGLPASGQAFAQGSLHQRLELPGLWLEEGRIAATDHALLDAPQGLAGHRVLATMWWAAGDRLPPSRLEPALDAARECLADSALPAGVTALDERMLVLRVLAHRVEPAMQLLRRVRLAWRERLWALSRVEPRVWQT